MCKQAVLTVVAVVTLAGASAAHGSSVHLTGDYGNFNFSLPGVQGIGTSTLHFAQSVPGRGNIVGDFVTTSTGSQFSVSLTNLLFDSSGVSPGVMTQIRLEAFQIFTVTTPGTMTTLHAISGTMGSDGGGGLVIANTTHDGATVLPTLSYGSPSGTPAPFSVGPFFGGNQIAAGQYLIEMQLDMVIDGNGFINLPTSFDSAATIVPAPGAGLLLGCTGLAIVRRRRV